MQSLQSLIELLNQDYGLITRSRHRAEQRARSSDPIQRRAGEVELGELKYHRDGWLAVACRINSRAKAAGLSCRALPDGSGSSAPGRREERRALGSTASRVTARSATSGKGKISGYASVFYDGTPGTQFELAPGVMERIHPTAFDSALRRGDKVIALLNHDPNFPLGSTAGGTLDLEVDNVGLHYTIRTAGDSSIDQHVVSHVRRGDIATSSFSFVPTAVEWTELDEQTSVRTITDLRLYDISPTVFGAYSGTTATA